ncbi:MAG TPA: chemotaxis protein CheW [Pirellulales bacterium]|nr:chemotaxis protein CheW [Pirellulales bacterium]
MEHAGQLSPEAIEELLARRALALEQPPKPDPLENNVLHVVTFTLAGERYGIEAESVREIVCVDDFTPIPGAPPFVTGVVNLRGGIVAVVDLRILLALPARGLVDMPQAIIVGRDTAEFGILATEVQEFVAVRPEELLEPSASSAGIEKALLKGVSVDAMLLLDGRKLLTDPRLFVNESANAGA